LLEGYGISMAFYGTSIFIPSGIKQAILYSEQVNLVKKCES